MSIFSFFQLRSQNRLRTVHVSCTVTDNFELSTDTVSMFVKVHWPIRGQELYNAVVKELQKVNPNWTFDNPNEQAVIIHPAVPVIDEYKISNQEPNTEPDA
jgi:hypothetical protein